MKRIGVLNHKGGVGKTFIAAHLLWMLRDFYHKRVYGIDVDSQCNLLKWIHGKGYVGGDVDEKDLYVKYGYGKSTFNVPEDKFDYVILDDRPSVEDFVHLVKHLDMIFIPVEGRMSIESAIEVKEVINEIGLNDNVFIIRNRILQDRVGLSRIENCLLAGLNGKVLPGGILESQLIRMASDLQIPVWRIKGQGYNRTGITPFLMTVCDKIINGG